MAKATQVQQLERIRSVKKLLLIGKTRSDILQYASDKWGSSERSCDDLIKTATLQIQEHTKDTTKMMLGKLVANQWELYLEARSKSDLAVARQLLMDIAKLTGVSIDRVIHEHRELNSLPEEELNALESELEGRVSFHN